MGTGGKVPPFFGEIKSSLGFENNTIYVFQSKRWCQNDFWFPRFVLAKITLLLGRVDGFTVKIGGTVSSCQLWLSAVREESHRKVVRFVVFVFEVSSNSSGVKSYLGER